MLSSVPAGQPFEIDTRLLYSPQSSFVASGQSSPRRCAASHGGSDAGGAAAQPHMHFSLPAYRRSTGGQQPLFADIGQAASALSPLHGGQASPWWPQQGADEAVAHPGQLRQEQPQPASRGATSSRPTSAPGSSQSARQLLLDDTLGQGVVGSTAQLLRQGREERIQQLAQPRVHLWQRCAEIKVQEEREELQVGVVAWVRGASACPLHARVWARWRCVLLYWQRPGQQPPHPLAAVTTGVHVCAADGPPS